MRSRVSFSYCPSRFALRRSVCEIEDERFRDFQKLLWWSCARRSEVSEARWSEIDLDERLWAIRASEPRTASAGLCHCPNVRSRCFGLVRL